MTSSRKGASSQSQQRAESSLVKRSDARIEEVLQVAHDFQVALAGYARNGDQHIQRLGQRIDDLHNSMKPDISALETRLQSLESFREMIFTFLTSLTIHKDVVLQVKLERERNERLKEEYPDAEVKSREVKS